MHLLPTAFLEIAVYLFCNMPFAFCFYFKTSPRAKVFIVKIILICMKVKLQVRLVVIRNSFARKLVLTLRQRELVNDLFRQETRKNEQLCQKS